MQRIVVGVLRGGPSSEYDVSLKTGSTVLEELDKGKYEPRDIFISKQGAWHVNGREVTIEKALRGVDVVFNALHGEFGEDGTVQRILDLYDIPYTGSGSVASAVAFNKQQTKDALKNAGINMAHGLMLETDQDTDFEKEALRIFRSFPQPWVIKPAAGGSSVGMSIARDFGALVDGLYRAHEVAPKILIEEYIRGREATCGVAEQYRGEDVYAFFPVEIIPPATCDFFSYEAKYSGETQELCPGNFTEAEKKTLAEAARIVHKHLRLSHYSRSDFIVTPKGVYFLEVNTLPGLTKESLLPKAVKAAGSKLSDFFDHLLTLARKRI